MTARAWASCMRRFGGVRNERRQLSRAADRKEVIPPLARRCQRGQAIAQHNRRMGHHRGRSRKRHLRAMGPPTGRQHPSAKPGQPRSPPTPAPPSAMISPKASSTSDQVHDLAEPCGLRCQGLDGFSLRDVDARRADGEARILEHLRGCFCGLRQQIREQDVLACADPSAMAMPIDPAPTTTTICVMAAPSL
jgi:hypothetical protein